MTNVDRTLQPRSCHCMRIRSCDKVVEYIPHKIISTMNDVEFTFNYVAYNIISMESIRLVWLLMTSKVSRMLLY